MNERNIKHIDEILKNNTIKYRLVNLENDPDINYLISVNSADVINNVEVINMLLYFTDNNEMGIYVFNVYKLNDGDSTLKLLNAINNANSLAPYGKFLFDEKRGVVYYYSKLKLENIMIELKDSIFNDYIHEALVAIMSLYQEIGKIRENEEL